MSTAVKQFLEDGRLTQGMTGLPVMEEGLRFFLAGVNVRDGRLHAPKRREKTTTETTMSTPVQTVGVEKRVSRGNVENVATETTRETGNKRK